MVCIKERLGEIVFPAQRHGHSHYIPIIRDKDDRKRIDLMQLQDSHSQREGLTTVSLTDINKAKERFKLDPQMITIYVSILQYPYFLQESREKDRLSATVTKIQFQIFHLYNNRSSQIIIVNMIDSLEQSIHYSFTTVILSVLSITLNPFYSIHFYSIPSVEPQ